MSRMEEQDVGKTIERLWPNDPTIPAFMKTRIAWPKQHSYIDGDLVFSAIADIPVEVLPSALHVYRSA